MSTDDLKQQRTSQLGEMRARSEHWFQALIEKSSEAIILVDRDCVLLYASPSLEHLLGYDSDTLLGRPIFDFFHHADSARGMQAFQSVVEGHEHSLTVTFRLRHADGSWRWMEGILTNLLDDPEIQAVVGNCRDVTERKRVEQELRASEQRYRMVVEHSSDIIALINDEGRWFYASPAAVKTLGYTRDEFAQADMCSLIHPDDLSVLQEGLTRAWRGELSSVTYRYLHKQGFWIMLETTCSALFDDDGIPEMLVCTAHDVTARTELEQRRDEFLSTTSHELRSPLTTIKASLQLAQRQFKRISEEPTEEVVRRIQEMLSMAERQVTVENRLIGDLLDVSRIHQNKLELHLTPCDLLCIVSTTVEDLQAVEQKRLINLDLPAVDGIPVVADVDRLGQVLTNYLTNAVKYSPIEQPIDVMLTTIDERVVKVSVRDYGRGLTPQEQEHVWERFYQSPDRVISKGSSGLGLGLYICRSIIEQHKGAVGLESQVGSGSTFWFTLPLQNE